MLKIRELDTLNFVGSIEKLPPIFDDVCYLLSIFAFHLSTRVVTYPELMT